MYILGSLDVEIEVTIGLILAAWFRRTEQALVTLVTLVTFETPLLITADLEHNSWPAEHADGVTLKSSV